LPLKDPAEWQFGVRKAFAGGVYAGQRLRSWSSSTSPVATNGYSHHHNLLGCSMSYRTHRIVATCWVWNWC